MFWSMILYIYSKNKKSLKFMQSFLRSEENDRRMNFSARTMPYGLFLFGELTACYRQVHEKRRKDTEET